MDAKQTSSVQDILKDKPPFGSRFLTNEAEVWTQNAWDHVPPPDDQDETIAAALAKQKSAPVPVEEQPKYNDRPARYWDNFYKTNTNHFFKDRKWLHNEFPELVAATRPEAGPKVVAEIGCGAGNSALPLLESNQNPNLKIYACDYSTHAVKVVQNTPIYVSPPTGSISASVWDLTSKDSLPNGMSPESVDIVVLVFVLSALHPNEWNQAVLNIHKMLKPGGLAVLRDYGRHDLTQLRFKGGRLLDDNFYIRGDKTRVYFFDLDELSLLFTGSKADRPLVETQESEKQETEDVTPDSSPHLPVVTPVTTADGNLQSNGEVIRKIHRALRDMPSSSALFQTEQLGIDRRLIVNRKRQLKMYRVWMQGKFRKLP